MQNELEFQVEWGDTDPAEIAFYPNFFRWFDHGTWHLLAALGLTYDVLRDEYGLIGCPIVEANSRFLSPARFWDRVQLTSHFHSVGRKSFKVGHAVRIGDRLCTEGMETRVWARASRDGFGVIEAVRIPDAIRRKLEDAGVGTPN